MAEQPNNLEEEIAALVNAGFSENQTAQDKAPPDGKTHGEETRRVIDVDLYRLPNGGVLLLPGGTANPLDQNAVESTTATPDKEQITKTPTIPLPPLTQVEQETEETQQVVPPAKRTVKPSSMLVPLMLLLILTAGTVTYLFLLPLTATADITITPLTRTLEKTTTFTIATTPHIGQVQGRSLQGISLTKSTTVPATGKGHQDAAQASGVITLYNTDSQPVTIPAGVTLTAPNGTTVIIDQSVTIQAAILPAIGTAISPAHVVQVGSFGNIQAHTIYTRCCGSVFVTATNNTPFTGGQDERRYSFVQSSDIQNATQTLLPPLTSQVTTALAKQAHTGEQLVTPLCTPHTTSSQDPGSEATEVTINVTQTCTSVLYSLDSLQQVATALLSHTQNLTNYEQVGSVQVTVNGSTGEPKTAQLQVTLSGTWVYRFSPRELLQLKRMIAGVSKARAQAMLQSHPGIQQVTISLKRLDFRDLLPTNPSNIHIIFIVS